LVYSPQAPSLSAGTRFTKRFKSAAQKSRPARQRWLGLKRRQTTTARRQEDERRQAEAAAAQASTSATAEAARLAARRCEDPNKLDVKIATVAHPNPTLRTTRYSADGTVRNTCNYDIDFKLELSALASNGSTVIATKTMGISPNGVGVDQRDPTDFDQGRNDRLRPT
jgi:hypothetical protein